MDLQPNKTDGIYLPITKTRISASEWNQLVGSCMAFITEAGLTPDASDNEQFLNAFKTIAAGLEIVGANTNLSNLTATGEARFTTKANTDLSNVNNTGKSRSAGWAMPSATHTDLTLGASGTTYTAPANGWVYWRFEILGTGYAEINSGSRSLLLHLVNGGQGIHQLPVRQGETFSTNYQNLTFPSYTYFRFIYAEGSKSEAN